MALLEESGKTGVYFYYPMGGGGTIFLRSIQLSIYQKVGVYFAISSAALLAWGVDMLASSPCPDHRITLFAWLIGAYSVIRVIVLFPKTAISRSKITKVSPAPLYMLIDHCCYFSAVAVMEWLVMRRWDSAPAYSIAVVALLWTLWVALPLINSVLLLIRQHAHR